MFRKLTPLLAVVLLFACAVTYYAPHDAETETKLMALQSKAEFFYQTTATELEAERSLSLETQNRFYGETQEILGNLQNKAESYLNNKDTVHELALLRESFDIAQDLQAHGFRVLDEVLLIQKAMDSHFRALLSLERAKPQRRDR